MKTFWLKITVTALLILTALAGLYTFHPATPQPPTTPRNLRQKITLLKSLFQKPCSLKQSISIYAYTYISVQKPPVNPCPSVSELYFVISEIRVKKISAPLCAMWHCHLLKKIPPYLFPLCLPALCGITTY